MQFLHSDSGEIKNCLALAKQFFYLLFAAVAAFTHGATAATAAAGGLARLFVANHLYDDKSDYYCDNCGYNDSCRVLSNPFKHSFYLLILFFVGVFAEEKIEHCSENYE